MPDAPKPAPKAGGKGLAAKVGPLPLWAWLIIMAAAGYLIIRYVGKKQAAATPTPSPSPAPDYATEEELSGVQSQVSYLQGTVDTLEQTGYGASPGLGVTPLAGGGMGGGGEWPVDLGPGAPDEDDSGGGGDTGAPSSPASSGTMLQPGIGAPHGAKGATGTHARPTTHPTKAPAKAPAHPTAPGHPSSAPAHPGTKPAAKPAGGAEKMPTAKPAAKPAAAPQEKNSVPAAAKEPAAKPAAPKPAPAGTPKPGTKPKA